MLTIRASIDGQWAATILLCEHLRDSAQTAVQALERMGLPVCIMTGDSSSSASAAAQLAPLDAAMTPEQKHQVVQALRNGKGDRNLLCPAPFGRFRQKAPVPFPAAPVCRRWLERCGRHGRVARQHCVGKRGPSGGGNCLRHAARVGPYGRSRGDRAGPPGRRHRPVESPLGGGLQPDWHRAAGAAPARWCWACPACASACGWGGCSPSG